MVAERRGGQHSIKSDTRNSPLRDLTDWIIQPTVRVLYRAGVSADGLSYMGAFGVAMGAFGAWLANKGQDKNPKLAAASMGEMYLAEATDGVDGSEARYTAQQRTLILRDMAFEVLGLHEQEIEDLKLDERTIEQMIREKLASTGKPLTQKIPAEGDFMRGQRLDYVNDRWQEGVMAWFRMLMADARGSKPGVFAAGLTLMTNALAGIARSEAEKKGYRVKETDMSPKIAGERPGRAALGPIATSFPEIKIKGHIIPMQVLIDFFTTAMNILVFLDRRDFKKNGEFIKDKKKREEIVKQAIVRNKSLKRVAGISALVAIATGAVLLSKPTSEKK